MQIDTSVNDLDENYRNRNRNENNSSILVNKDIINFSNENIIGNNNQFYYSTIIRNFCILAQKLIFQAD